MSQNQVAQRIMSPASCRAQESMHLRKRHANHHRQVQYGRVFSVIMCGESNDSGHASLAALDRGVCAGGGPADRCHTYPEVLIRVRLLKLRRGFAT